MDEAAAEVTSAGELNYCITRMVILYVRRFGKLSYETLVEKGLAHLAAATLEFYRLAMGRYEDGKIEQNGNVYEEELFY